MNHRSAATLRALAAPALLAAFGLVFCALVAGGCGKEKPGTPPPANAQTATPAPPNGAKNGGQPPQPPAPVAVKPAVIGSIASFYKATATLEAEKQAQVLARVAGVVRSLAVEEGDQVRAAGAAAADRQRRVPAARGSGRRPTAEPAGALRAPAGDAGAGAHLGAGVRGGQERPRERRGRRGAGAPESLLHDGGRAVLGPGDAAARQRRARTCVGTPLFDLADFDPLLARVHVPAKEFRKLRADQPVELRPRQSDGERLQGASTWSARSSTRERHDQGDHRDPDYPPGVRPGDFAEVRIVTDRHDGRDPGAAPRRDLRQGRGRRLRAPPTAPPSVASSRWASRTTTRGDPGGLRAGEPVVVRGSGRSSTARRSRSSTRTTSRGDAERGVADARLHRAGRPPPRDRGHARLAVIAFGLVGYQRLPLELFPDITYPSLTVQTEFPDTAPQEVENLVTRPVEEAVGVSCAACSPSTRCRARASPRSRWSSTGAPTWTSCPWRCARSSTAWSCPRKRASPVVLRFDPALDPVVRLALSGPAT